MEAPQIYERMAAIMADLPAIGKDSVNDTQHFRFRGIDDVMNTLKPILVKHGVFISPKVLHTELKEFQNSKGTLMHRCIVEVEYRFIATDGSSVECSVVGEGMDSGDKACSKAMSIAMKYAMFQTFCIPTDDDPDYTTPEDQSKVVCSDCGQVITGKIFNGTRLTPAEIAEKSAAKFGRVLCYDCSAKASK